MITRVQLFSLPVSDQARAKAFYVDTLGFDLISEADMGPDMHWLQVAPRGAATAITLVTWFPSMPAGSVRGTVLETDSLDADVATLRERGIEIADIEEQPWGRYVQFSDPDGNGLILQETTPWRQ
jgi:catechol 2,3-dioxygenase-like lactoylglutathione lyase family enzyme